MKIQGKIALPVIPGPDAFDHEVLGQRHNEVIRRGIRRIPWTWYVVFPYLLDIDGEHEIIEQHGYCHSPRAVFKGQCVAGISYLRCITHRLRVFAECGCVVREILAGMSTPMAPCTITE